MVVAQSSPTPTAGDDTRELRRQALRCGGTKCRTITLNVRSPTSGAGRTETADGGLIVAVCVCRGHPGRRQPNDRTGADRPNVFVLRCLPDAIQSGGGVGVGAWQRSAIAAQSNRPRWPSGLDPRSAGWKFGVSNPSLETLVSQC